MNRSFVYHVVMNVEPEETPSFFHHIPGFVVVGASLLNLFVDDHKVWRTGLERVVKTAGRTMVDLEESPVVNVVVDDAGKLDVIGNVAERDFLSVDRAAHILRLELVQIERIGNADVGSIAVELQV